MDLSKMIGRKLVSELKKCVYESHVDGFECETDEKLYETEILRRLAERDELKKRVGKLEKEKSALNEKVKCKLCGKYGCTQRHYK